MQTFINELKAALKRVGPNYMDDFIAGWQMHKDGWGFMSLLGLGPAVWDGWKARKEIVEGGK